MNRRRLLAAVFFSLVIIAVLGVIVGAEIVSGGQTVSVLRLRTDVQSGAVYSAGDADAVALRIAPGDLNYVTPGSVPTGSRYALSLRAGDVLSPDDLEPATAQIAVTLTVSNPPPIEVGQTIDVFAAVDQSQVLIGHAVPVLNVSGGQLTVLVGSRDELAWVEIAASNTSLHAVVSIATDPAGLPPAGVDQAVCQLAPRECAALGNLPPAGAAVSAPTPLPTPTPTPTPSP